MKTFRKWFKPLPVTRFYDVESDAVDFASRDTLRLTGETQMDVFKKSPYADTIEGGTLENLSESLRSVVQRRAMPASSMVFPQFTALTDSCGKVGGTDQVGFTEFIYAPGNYRGRGPKICIKGTRTGFPSEYKAAVEALKNNIVQLTNADIRANYLQNSGSKVVAVSGQQFENCFRGNEYDVQQPYPNFIPDSPLSFAGLQSTSEYMREILNVLPFENPKADDGMLKYIGSLASINMFRDELNIRADVIGLTTGQYEVGQKTIQGYTWQGPYHGIGFAVDPDPVRALGWQSVTVTYQGQSVATKVPVFVEPWISAVVSNGGVAAVRNPQWVKAPYEFAFLFGMNSFKRLVPAAYRVEGWPFVPQTANGALEFKQLIDRGTMTLGDYGQHFYEIERAFRPLSPHACAVIAYARCQDTDDFTACGKIEQYS